MELGGGRCTNQMKRIRRGIGGEEGDLKLGENPLVDE
jgi:hypothetical protein